MLSLVLYNKLGKIQISIFVIYSRIKNCLKLNSSTTDNSETMEFTGLTMCLTN